MRALGILIILFHHLPAHTFNFYDLRFFSLPYDFSWINDLNRYFALGNFVFISGFVLTCSYRTFGSGREIMNFILKRYIRIVPLYIISLLIYIFIYRDLLAPMTTFSYAAHLLGLQVLLASRICEPVFTLWYIGLIIAYYFLYVVLARYGRSLGLFFSLVLLAAFVTVAIMFTLGFIDKRFLLYLGPFIIGILFARYNLFSMIRLRHISVCLMICLACIWTYVRYVYPVISSASHKPGLFSLVGMLAFCLTNLIMITSVVIMYHLAGRIANGQNISILEKISYASYCMYLFHRPLWWVMSKIFLSEHPLIQLSYMSLLGIPLIFLSSYFIQKLYDKFPARYLNSLLH